MNIKIRHLGDLFYGVKIKSIKKMEKLNGVIKCRNYSLTSILQFIIVYFTTNINIFSKNKFSKSINRLYFDFHSQRKNML